MIFSRFASSDVDECSADVHICGSNANCTNTNGSYYCSCHSGFTRSGKECVGKDIMYRLLLKLLILFVWDTQKASCYRTLLIFINCSWYKFSSCSVLVRHLSVRFLPPCSSWSTSLQTISSISEDDSQQGCWCSIEYIICPLISLLSYFLSQLFILDIRLSSSTVASLFSYFSLNRHQAVFIYKADNSIM